MKSHFFALFSVALLATLLLLPVHVFSADNGGLATLRGTPIKNTVTTSNDALKKAMETKPLDRDFTQQPPLVSHAVDTYPVTLKFNKCLDCHSWERYREEKATKVSQTHFKTSTGEELSTVSPRRYFCLQCHVPQVDAKPLVANTYQRPTNTK
jgi:cytochrome c-type protein NapB